MEAKRERKEREKKREKRRERGCRFSFYTSGCSVWPVRAARRATCNGTPASDERIPPGILMALRKVLKEALYSEIPPFRVSASLAYNMQVNKYIFTLKRVRMYQWECGCACKYRYVGSECTVHAREEWGWGVGGGGRSGARCRRSDEATRPKATTGLVGKQ